MKALDGDGAVVAPEDRRREAAPFVGSSGVTLAGAVLGGVLSLANEVAAARFLGVAGYGSYGVAMLMAKAGEILALFGAPLTVLRFLPVHLNRSHAALAAGVIVTGIIAPLCIGTILAISGLVWHDAIAGRWFHDPAISGFIAVLACAIPLLAMSDLLGNIARGFGHPLPFVVIRNILPSATSIIIIAGVWLAGGPQIGAAVGYVAAVGVGTLAGTAIVIRLARSHFAFFRPTLDVMGFYRFAAPIALNSVVTMALIWTDMFVLATMSDVKTVGIYRGCTQIVICFDMILAAVSAGTMPTYTVLASEGRRETLQATLMAASRFTSLLAAPIAALLIFNASDVMATLGPDFQAGVPVLVILALAQCIKATVGASSIMLIVSGKQSLEALNSALAACLNLAMALFLVPRYGLLGAAAATAFSLLMLSALRVTQVRHVLQLRLGLTTIARVGAIAAVASASIWFASDLAGFGSGSGIPALIGRLAASGLATALGLWVFGLDRSDRSAIVSFFVRRQGRVGSASAES